MTPYASATDELEHLLKRVPVTNVGTLTALNQDEVQEGYRDGRDNFPCGENRSRSYWHGWRNGMMDGKHMKSDWASQLLAADYIRSNPPKWDHSVTEPT